MSEENAKVEEQHQSQDALGDGVDGAVPEVEIDMSGEVDSVEESSQHLNDEVAEPAALTARIEELEDLLKQANDRSMRAQADAMNTIRRAEQDVEKAHKFALDKFVGELIPVVESLEKGIESVEQLEGNYEAVLQGMQLIQKQFLDALVKFKVEQVNPVSEPFDPNFHQAISMVPNPDIEPNTVMEVFQKGYTLHGRVVRPAMVVVSKGTAD